MDVATRSPLRELSENREQGYRKTKIVATAGPSSKSPERVRELIAAGVNVFRLNFSHGSHEEHLALLKTIRGAATEMGAVVAILQDLSGPKIRISNVEGDFVTINDRETIELCFADGKKSDGKRIRVEIVNPVEALKPGHQVLLADGLIELQAQEVKDDHVVCTIVKGGRIRSRVGIAFPDSSIDLPATTEKDLHDMKWGIEHKVDFVAISFVKSAADIRLLRDAISKGGGDVAIISKIERRAALDNIEEIIDATDGLMVARGDLGLEIPLERVPQVQQRLIEMCNNRGIPVIVATQMLHSMITSTRPTRAEVSDIAAAVTGGADAVMLSDETAIGENPLEAVRYLSRIAQAAERGFTFEEFKLRLREPDRLTVPDSVAYAVCAASIKVSAAAIIACSETGTSARLVSKYRPQQPLYGASTRDSTLRRMALYWGVIPISITSSETHVDEIELAMKTVQLQQQLPNGALAVISGGRSVRVPGATSVLEIRELNYR